MSPGPSSDQAASARARRWQVLSVMVLLLAVAGGLALALGAFRSKPVGTLSANGIRGERETTSLLRGVPYDGLRLGRADAPATIRVFADLHCPICRAHFTGSEQRDIVDRLVRPGRAKLELRLLATLSPNSAVGRTAVERLALGGGEPWRLATMLFYNQGAEGGAWISPDLLRRIGEASPGLRGVSTTPDGRTRRLEAETEALRRRYDVGGTPTYVVTRAGAAGYDKVRDRVFVDVARELERKVSP
ncbi:thioredoxin domain-containing protein [Patulibacter brassicae]|uniref:Thioredoxin domain-containing protein n=1 Tax=Patulibacter brassicae TaxID=1705717 RepID=A0ABU4VPW3_9ACTN|nr:thioredoxin domain-containing protein [Patulibacter brassicae]MDX8153377.1 thioredoxin domain-containing protein [Patulibacter brassicae]